MNRSDGPDKCQGPDPHVDIRMLQLELDQHREGSHGGDVERNSQKKPGQRTGGNLDELVDWMLYLNAFPALLKSLSKTAHFAGYPRE